MDDIEVITKNTIADIKSQRTTRSCILGGISLEKYSIVVETGNSSEVSLAFRKKIDELN